MRCMYCHNPDTWSYEKNKEIEVDEIIKKYDSVKEFLSNGGLSATGGEPLCQIDFLIELFKAAKEKNIHTTLDTSGILFDKNNTKKFDELIKYTNLVMLDIKHIDDNEHKKLTGKSNKNVLDFARYLSQNNVDMWIRHVVVKDLTDDEKYLSLLGEFISTLKTVKALDVLPYHDMAVEKYKALGIKYPLSCPPLSKQEAIKARDIILKSLQNKKHP